MRTSDSKSEWTRPELVGVSCTANEKATTVVPAICMAQGKGEQGQIPLALTDYPDVGRVSEVAAVLRCSKWCVYDLINTGALRSIRLGRAIRVTRRALEEFLTG